VEHFAKSAKYLNTLQKTGGIFITVPFINYRKAIGETGKLEKHNNSEKQA
jgi:hypothetical protein